MALAGRWFLAVIGAAALSGCFSTSGGGSETPSSPAQSPEPAEPAPAPAPAPEEPSGHTVSGAFLADPALDVDSDLRDPAQNTQANDELAQAQPVGGTTELRGHVACQPSSTVPDACDGNSDLDDIYRMNLEAGQLLTLTLHDYEQGTSGEDLDLDLYLFDGSGDLVAASLEYASAVEQVIVPETAEYRVNVNAFKGGTNYSLTITDSRGTALKVVPVTMDRLAPDRLTLLSREISKARKASGLDGRPIGFEADGRARSRFIDRAELRLNERGPLSLDYPERVFGLKPRKGGDATYRAKLALLAEFKRVNHAAGRKVAQLYHYPKLHFASPPPDPDLQWNLASIGWQEALTIVENQAPERERPLIAVLDSGVLSAHPKIAPVLTEARDFVPEFVDGDGFNAEAEETVDPNDPNPDDCFRFHGTHVASTATAPAGDGAIEGVNMTGALPFADLMMLKLGDSRDPNCNLIVGDVATAVRYAAGLENASNFLPERPADVINMSFGGPEPDAATREAIEDAVAAGVIVVASAGNEGEDGTQAATYPAAFPDVIAVAATDIENRRAPYSSFYPQVEVAAPGGDLRYDLNIDGFADGIVGGVGKLNEAGTGFEARYALMQGTSMAAPQVAAGFALMKSIYPALTSAQAHQLLADGVLTDDLGPLGRDSETGYGLVSFVKMADAAIQLRDQGTVSIPADFRVEPAEVDLGNTDSRTLVEVIRSGDPDFVIQSVTFESEDVPSGALTAPEAEAVDAEGFGTYRIGIDRSALTAGDFSARLTVTASNADVRVVRVSFTVPEASRLAGTAPARLYLERADGAGGFEPVTSLVSAAGAGGDFSMQGVEDGTYRLRFTTDMDGDGAICDPGELGGTYPGGACDSPATFDVPADTGSPLQLVLRRLQEN